MWALEIIVALNDKIAKEAKQKREQEKKLSIDKAKVSMHKKEAI
jgi:hypothetical protein